jgi:membrane fusion protein (multidrug efflux system)
MSVLAACGDKAASQSPAGGPPPPEVSVVTVEPSRIALTSELPGRIEASRIAQVRARVAGIVLKRTFREGSDVKAGDVLFQIDPAQFKAVVASAQAALAKTEANLAQSILKVQRFKPLVATNAISKQEYDDALTAQKQTEADVATAKATLQTATLNLGYATVTAPISGRIGRAQVTEGALVGMGEATPLATIQQIDPVYVNLTQSSLQALKLQRALAAGKLQRAGEDQTKVTVVTEDGQTMAQTGKLLFSDLTVDESSGAVTLRAEIPNKDRLLLPGMYVRARLDQAIDESAIIIPQQAVSRGPAGALVMLVAADGKVSSQPVKTGRAQEQSWIITDGLKAGDVVIVEGMQKAKVGGAVKPMPWKPAAAQVAAAPTPAAASTPAK